MKRIVSLLLASALLCGAMLSLASCGAPEDAGAQIAVNLGGEVFDFDPTDYYTDSNAEQIMSLLYEPLFKLNSKGELSCAAAKDYSVDEYNRVITVTLRESYWSDEIRVQASDYIYAWRDVILEPSNPNPAAALLYDIENAIATKAGDTTYSFGAVSTGAFELKITYREGADYKQLLKNLASVATSPLRQDVVSVAKTYWSKDVSTIVTNGPFSLKTFNYDVGEFTLARNLGYHQNPGVKDYDDEVVPAELVSIIAADEEYTLSYSDIENKTVFFMSDISLEDRAANAKYAKSSDDLSTYTYVFNTEKGIFKDKNVRRALSLAINRADIIENVIFGKAATGFLTDAVAKSIYGKNPIARISNDHEANLSEAKSLIAAANLTADEKAFVLTVNDDEESVKIAEIAKAAWAELGFNVKIDKVTSVTEPINDVNLGEERDIEDSAIQVITKEASYGNRDFDVIALDWHMYSTDAIVALSAFTSHMNGNGKDLKTGVMRENISGWTNADFDQYINLAYYADSEEQRNEALKKAEEILLNESPIAPLIYNQSFAFISGELKSVSFDGFGNFVFTKAKQKNYHDYLPQEEE